MRLAEPEMTPAKQRNYLKKVIDKAEKERKRVVARKSNATMAKNAGRITAEEKKANS